MNDVKLVGTQAIPEGYIYIYTIQPGGKQPFGNWAPVVAMGHDEEGDIFPIMPEGSFFRRDGGAEDDYIIHCSELTDERLEEIIEQWHITDEDFAKKLRKYIVFLRRKFNQV